MENFDDFIKFLKNRKKKIILVIALMKREFIKKIQILKMNGKYSKHNSIKDKLGRPISYPKENDLNNIYRGDIKLYFTKWIYF